MDRSARRKTVAGIFREREAAASAVKALAEAHFDPDSDVTMIVSHGHDHRERISAGATFEIGRNAAIGAAVGALTAAVGMALAGLDFGFFTMENAGPVWAALEAGYIGGCVGFALGALLSMDLARAGSGLRHSRVEGGVILVGVQASGARAERAHEILGAAGARHFMEEDAQPVGAAA